LAAELVTDGDAQCYQLSISWGSSCLADVRGERVELGDTQIDRPKFERPTNLRPLQHSKMDLAGAVKRPAKEIEAKIVE
jgi:hypothetical protein